MRTQRRTIHEGQFTIVGVPEATAECSCLLAVLASWVRIQLHRNAFVGFKVVVKMESGTIKSLR